MKNRMYKVWINAFWDALGCGLNEENAEKHANHKLEEYTLAVKKAKSYFKMIEKRKK